MVQMLKVLGGVKLPWWSQPLRTQCLGLQEEMSAQRGAGHTVGRYGAGIQAFSFLGKEDKFTLPENEIEKPNNISGFLLLGVWMKSNLVTWLSSLNQAGRSL